MKLLLAVLLLSRDALLSVLIYLAIVVGAVVFLFWLLDQLDPAYTGTRKVLKVVVGIVGGILVLLLLLDILGIQPV